MTNAQPPPPPPWKPRRLLLLVVLLLSLSGAAHAQFDPNTTLNAAASEIAGRPVYVLCLEQGDDGYPGDIGAWAYVYLAGDNEFMSEEVCEGLNALAAQDDSAPAWRQALGALVLTHESFHLNQAVKEPGNEARTECRAIKNWARTVQLLGGTSADVERLLPYALALHWRLAAKVPAYNWEGCRAPNFWPPDES